MDSLEPYRLLPEREDLDIWLIPRFAESTLKLEPDTLDHLLANYPERGSAAKIVPGVCQWVTGANRALHYRGHELKRSKMWFQKGDPLKTKRWIRYGYTGWMYDVLPATSDIDQCAELAPAFSKYNDWCAARGKPAANHAIVTAYRNGGDSIGFHFDKPRDIRPSSLITVVKLGEEGRPFAVREGAPAGADRAKQPILWQGVIPPGSALVMTLEANLLTEHAVPEVEDAGLTGSIVLRTIDGFKTDAELAEGMRKAEETRNRKAGARSTSSGSKRKRS